VLEFRAAGLRLATPVRPGMRLRPTDRQVAVHDALLPLRGVLAGRLLVPVVDLGYLLGGEPSQTNVAIEAPAADGPIAFQVDVALDVRAVPIACFRVLPPLLRAVVLRSEALSLALVRGQVLPILLRDHCARLADGATEVRG